MRCYSNIVSVFSSIQGEGLFVGVPQLFIRFGGCNLHCRYCDTPAALSHTRYAQIETKPFFDKSASVPNPVSSSVLVNKLSGLMKAFPDYHSVSVTGGEPLLHTGFLKQILPPLRRKLPILLETNGILPLRLKEVINLVDIISMDIKMPSDLSRNHRLTQIDTDDNQPNLHWHNIELFLKLANAKPDSYIKIVITDNTVRNELLAACRIIRKINKDMPVILQPATKLPYHKGFKAPTPAKLLESYKIMSRGLNDVRIIPQVHRLMNWK